MTEQQRVLILRSPDDGGNFSYRMAELPGEEANRLEHMLESDGPQSAGPEIGRVFGKPVSLREAMENLRTRDFRVIDYPA